MFWIPIACIAFVIWYVLSLVNGIRTVKYNREYQRERDAAEAFRELTRDRDLEQQLRWQFEDRKIDCNAVVREFMGGHPKWDDYTGGNAYGRNKAEMVLMARHGKFPGITSSFTIGSVNPRSRFIESQWADMNVEFLMKLQSTLRQRLGRNVVLYVTYQSYETGQSVTCRRRLNECVARGEGNRITWAASLEFVIE